MATNESKRATQADKTTMYRATKLVVYRNNMQMMNEATANSFFTSRTKAVDALRRYAEEIEDAKGAWTRFKEGSTFAFRDVFVFLWIYEESEGAFVRTDAIRYAEIMEGVVADNSNDPAFETF